MKILFAIVAAATAISAQAGPLVAQGDSVVVRYDDLNLGSARGQAMLDRRIVHAAQSVCGVISGSNELAQTVESDRCFRQAVAGARTRFASARAPVLAAR